MGGAGGTGGMGGLDAGDDASVDPGVDGGDDAGDDASIGDSGGEDSGGSGGRGGSGGEEDGGDGGAGGGDVKPRGLLDLCTADEDCGGDFLCRPMYVGGPKRCTRECTTSSQCMMGTRCESIGEERYCVQGDVGRLCSSDDECNSKCLPNQGYCTSQCSSGGDCPNGFGCASTGSGKVCVKVAIYCDQRDPSAGTCAPQGAACDPGSGLIVQSCTTRCQFDSDCPQRALGLAPWRCNPGDGYCDRPNDIFGPVPGGRSTEYACQYLGSGPVRNLCNDGLQTNVDAWTNIDPPFVNCYANDTTLGKPGDMCIDTCRYQGGCQFGTYCAALTSVGNPWRVGVCLPTGHGEIGDPCTRHRDCAFGYCNLNTNKCSRDCSADDICPSGSTCVATGVFVETKPFKRCE